MSLRSKYLIIFGTLFILSFLYFAYYILDISELSGTLEEGKPLTGKPKVIFGILLMQCMILGMLANYIWDLFNSGKSWADITWRGIALPLMVSPMIFFGIWSMWKGDPIAFSLPLISFQNGFFWQVIFSKERQHYSRTIQPSI